MTPLVRKALSKADEIRRRAGLNMFQPINVFDVCVDLGITVRFLDVNMEGMYVAQNNGESPNILLSNQRPLPRRNFTCAHELGHHLFNHGSKMDALTEYDPTASSYDGDELLVDAFAGALLMPVAGIQAEFAKRDWNIDTATPLQIYTVASVFGTGYSTLITHCKVNKLIRDTAGNALLKFTPAKILESIIGSNEGISNFKIIDGQTNLTAIDIEVNNLLILPANIEVEGEHLQKYKDTSLGIAYIAKKPGIVRAKTVDDSVSYFIKIQNAGYIGLAEYRHLESE